MWTKCRTFILYTWRYRCTVTTMLCSILPSTPKSLRWPLIFWFSDKSLRAFLVTCVIHVHSDLFLTDHMNIVLWMIRIMKFLSGGRETKFYSILKTGKKYSLVWFSIYAFRRKIERQNISDRMTASAPPYLFYS